MSSITADGMAATAGVSAGEQIGPLEQKHLLNANYRAVTDGTEVSKTHWHIAAANALGWGFDGMDGVIFALVAPMVIKEFSLSVPEYRSGLQISLFVGIAAVKAEGSLAERCGVALISYIVGVGIGSRVAQPSGQVSRLGTRRLDLLLGGEL